MGWLRRMMYGRYGMDQLGMALAGAYFLFYLLSLLLPFRILRWISLLCVLAELFRMFSKQIGKRRAENEKFLSVAGPLIRKYNVWRCRRNDRDHAYFKCPGCGQQLRAPKGKGKISVTCRSCGATFEKKT